MKSTIDSAGRVIIPSEIRRLASLTGRRDVEVTWEDGRVVVEARPLEVKIVKRGRFLVGEPAERVPRMSQELVGAEIDRQRSTPR